MATRHRGHALEDIVRPIATRSNGGRRVLIDASPVQACWRTAARSAWDALCCLNNEVFRMAWLRGAGSDKAKTVGGAVLFP